MPSRKRKNRRQKELIQLGQTAKLKEQTMTSRNAELQQQVDALTIELNQAKENLRRGQTLLSQKVEALKDRQQACLAFASLTDDLSAKLADQEREVTELRQTNRKLAKLQQALPGTQKSIRQMRKRLRDKSTRISSLQTEVIRLKAEAQGA